MNEPLAELSGVQARLLAAVRAAHHACVFRENPSSVALRIAYQASGSFAQALTAALATLGGVHAPLAETYRLLNAPDPAAAARALLAEGHKVPGWGTSFKDDPHWQPVADILQAEFPEHFAVIQSVTAELHAAGKMIEPNPSAWTAGAALVLGLPEPLAAWLFVSGRVNAWASLTLETGPADRMSAAR